MMLEKALENLSGLALLEVLKKRKRQLIAEKKIIDKKDSNVYPINSVPFDVPSNWTWCYLSDVSIIQEGPGIRKHQYSKSGVQFLTVTNILEGDVDLEKSKKYISPEQYKNYAHFTVNKGDVVTACSGGSWGKSAIYDLDEKIILNTSTLRLRFFGDLGDNRYLYYLTKASYFKESLSIHTTGQQPNYGYFHYSRIPIPLPPLAEQKRIVEILDEAFAAIDKAKANVEKNLQNAKELFESYLYKVFANKGADWVEETLETLLEKGWITSHLDGNHGGEYPRKEEFKTSGVPYISANCIKGTTVDFSLSKYLTPERSLTIRKGIAVNNDVLFAHNATVGPVALLKTKEPKVILGTSLTYYRCNSKFILPEYLAHYMRSKEFKQQYELVMRQSTRNQVPITKQREFYHIIPPIETQKELIKTLEDLLEQSQKLKIFYQKKLENLDELKKSILQKAFTGELTAKALTVIDED